MHISGERLALRREDRDRDARELGSRLGREFRPGKSGGHHGREPPFEHRRRVRGGGVFHRYAERRPTRGSSWSVPWSSENGGSENRPGERGPDQWRIPRTVRRPQPLRFVPLYADQRGEILDLHRGGKLDHCGGERSLRSPMSRRVRIAEARRMAFIRDWGIHDRDIRLCGARAWSGRPASRGIGRARVWAASQDLQGGERSLVRMRRVGSGSGGKPLQPGFTMIEVLISLGVIVVLASLVVGASRPMLQRVASLQSVSNLRQFGLAYARFASENDGKIPRQPAISRTLRLWDHGLWKIVGLLAAPLSGI